MKKFIILSSLIFSFAILLTLTSTNKVLAASCSWNGSVNGNWSNPANWNAGCSGAGGIPGDTDALTFPTGGSNTTMTNDIVGLDVTLISLGSTAYTFNGNDLNLNGTIVPTTTSTTFNININLTGNSQIEAGTFNGDINIGSNTLNLNVSWDDLIINGEIIGSGQINVSTGSNTATLNTDSLSYTGLINLTGGNLVIQGNFSDAAVTITGGALLEGSGRIGTLTVTDGDVAPGVGSTDILSVSGNLTLSSLDTLFFELNGTTLGTQYDQIEVGGNVSLNNSILNLNLGYSPSLGDQYILIDATGSTISGTFAGLPSGSEIDIGGEIFVIGYTTEQVILTRSATLLFLGITTNPSTVINGSNVVLTATWSSRGGPLPTGTVNFVRDSIVIASNIPLVNGVASFTLNGVTTGTYSIESEYSGDGIYGGAISQPFSLQVLATLANTGISIPIASILIFGLSSLVLLFLLEIKQKRNN